MEYIRALAGIAFFILIAWLLSTNRKKIDWKLVGTGLVLQIILGIIILRDGYIASAFSWISDGFVRLISFTDEGTAFLFGEFTSDKYGFIFAFKVLPTLIFFSTVTAGLYHLGWLQRVVKSIAWVMARTMKLSGAESLSAAGNIFLGQTEAPLLVRPFIPKMTKSEIMCLMTGGMATIAGGVLAGYVMFLGGDDPAEQQKYATYLLSASFMNAPAAIVFAKIIVPEPDHSNIQRDLAFDDKAIGVNLIDAVSRGASDGLKLALNVGAMILAFIALIAMINFILKDVIGHYSGLNELIISTTNGNFEGFSLEYILGSVFRVFAFAMGVEWKETLQVGSLLGQKTVINEFVAYLDLSRMKGVGMLSAKSELIAAYALCGFANFSSIAIQIGGIGGIAPNQQGQLSKLGMRALIAATLATMLTATWAGVMVEV